MSSSISSVSAASNGPSSTAAESAALSKLMATYRAILQQGQTPEQLASLAAQIAVAAEALGHSVSLPTSDSSAVSSAVTPAQSGTSLTGYA